ncbi:MFS transporter [Nocardia sp. NPDC059091]|uniref:MFS transporter n=1 Tax=Nocardia sp. NPDC059091 TaxID=3346724 RepID=UPI0036944F00
MQIDPNTAADSVPRADRSAWIGLGVLAAGLSLIVVDGTIVGVALPVIVTDLGLDLTDAQWVNSAYSVVFAALLLTAGRLGDRLGRRRMFVLGVLVFLAGSLMAAVASSVAALILSRVVQGVGGAFVLPATLSSVNATFRGKDRVIAFAVWGAVISGMAAVGPLLGGSLTTYFGWRWIFIVNIPIGAAVLIGTLLAVRETRPRSANPGSTSTDYCSARSGSAGSSSHSSKVRAWAGGGRTPRSASSESIGREALRSRRFRSSG